MQRASLRGRTLCCVKSRLFFTTGSHGSQGPEFCTPDAVLNGSCTLLLVGGFQGCSGINNVIIGALRKRPLPPSVEDSFQWQCEQPEFFIFQC